jgi:hypothetical protein
VADEDEPVVVAGARFGVDVFDVFDVFGVFGVDEFVWGVLVAGVLPWWLLL